MTTWTAEQDRALVEQVKAGRSLLEIHIYSLATLGREYSRNAISGRVWRLRRKSGDETLRAGIAVGRVSPRRLTSEERASANRGGWFYAKRKAGRGPPQVLLRQMVGPSPDADMLKALDDLAPKRKRRRSPGLPDGMNDQGIVCCEAVTIHQLFHDMCHWPLWQAADPLDFDELKYCGNACKGVYCEAHRRLGYYQGRRRRSPEERAMAVRNHFRFQSGGQNIGRAA